MQTGMQWFDLPSEATQEEIRREYKRLAKLHHPDRSPPEARWSKTRAFQEITDAYERRMAVNPWSAGRQPGHDLFDKIKRRCFDCWPSPTVSGFPCTLEELFTGGVKDFEWRDSAGHHLRIPVRIAAGTRHATKLVISSVLRTGPIRSDLILIVIQMTHPTFERRANDLHTSVALARDKALGGWTHALTLLDGSVRHIEHGPTTQARTQVLVPGGGMPSETLATHGDLVVTFYTDVRDLTHSPQTS